MLYQLHSDSISIHCISSLGINTGLYSHVYDCTDSKYHIIVGLLDIQYRKSGIIEQVRHLTIHIQWKAGLVIVPTRKVADIMQDIVKQHKKMEPCNLSEQSMTFLLQEWQQNVLNKILYLQFNVHSTNTKGKQEL